MEEHSHLPLPRPVNFVRKSRAGFGYEQAKRNPKEFYHTEAKKLDIIGDAYKKDIKKHQEYLEPNLIFKINLVSGVSDEAFRINLRGAGIDIISSSPDKTGYWVAFTDDAKFTKFRQKLKERITRVKANFVDAIGGIEEISPDEKLGKSLVKRPLIRGRQEYLDVEIWRMKDDRLEKFMIGLEKMILKHHGEIYDKMVTGNFCVLRVKCNDELLTEMTGLREVSNVNRPPRTDVHEKLDVNIEDFDAKGTPDEKDPGILIVDSGIRKHPLIDSAVADTFAVPTLGGEIRQDRDVDDVGHGTKIAGISLYGDIGRCIEAREFVPRIWLYSAKVMYRGDDGAALFDEKSLLENQLKDAVERTIKKYKRCRIINISFGDPDKAMASGQRQFRIAALIDELSTTYPDVIFAISAGNTDNSDKPYPDYLMGDSPEVRIIDPATSAHGITVGSISKDRDLPSPFTRVGPGLQNMIKPELTDYGGGFGLDLTTINPNWASEGRLFTLDRGTSFSTPKIAHYLAKISNAFPGHSRNFLKALLLSSAAIPQERPGPLGEIGLCDRNEDLQNLLNVYGYGKPDLYRALHSESNRVLLIYEGYIGLKRVELFAINLPEEFILEKGERSIEVTLAFDPPTDSNRANYLGVSMEYHLFRDLPVENVRKLYGKIAIDESTNIVPKQIRGKEIKLMPGINLRKKGIHQKSIKQYKIKPQIDIKKPLVLAVICQKNWQDENGYKQPYSVIVTFRHNRDIDLYNAIRIKNVSRGRVR